MEIDIKSKRKTEVAPPPPQIIKSLDIPDAPKPRYLYKFQGRDRVRAAVWIVVISLCIAGALFILDSMRYESSPKQEFLKDRQSQNDVVGVEEVVVADSDAPVEYSSASNIEIPSHSNISVWKEYNDYNGEETNCYWLINPTRKTVDYVAYFSSSESQVLHSFKFYTTTWKKFKKLHPGVRLYLNQKDRVPYSMTNSTTILVSGPHENESETWGYPVYTIMLPDTDKTYVFINSPDGEKTYLSYAILKKLNN